MTGWIVTSDSVSGSRLIRASDRLVSTQTSPTNWVNGLRPRGQVRRGQRDGGHAVTSCLLRSPAPSLSGLAAGERQEHVVERCAAHRDVVDLDPGRVERAHHLGGQPVGGDDGDLDEPVPLVRD